MREYRAQPLDALPSLRAAACTTGPTSDGAATKHDLFVVRYCEDREWLRVPVLWKCGVARPRSETASGSPKAAIVMRERFGRRPSP